MCAYFFFDALLALPLRQIRGQLHDFVDDAQIVLVMQQTALGRDFGVDPSPERDIRFQLRGTHERVFVGDRAQRRNGESTSNDEQGEAAPDLIH